MSYLGMTSSYCHCESPNSWLAAGLLRRIKEEWDLPERITFQEILSVQVCLTSIFDHYRTNLKAVIKTIDFIKLHLVCKATVSDVIINIGTYLIFLLK